MVITVVIALEQRMFFLGQHLTQAVSYYGQVREGLTSSWSPTRSSIGRERRRS